MAMDLGSEPAALAAARTAIEEATAVREQEAAVFAKASAELQTNVAVIGDAIVALEKGQADVFLQTQSASVLKTFLENEYKLIEADCGDATAFLAGAQGTSLALHWDSIHRAWSVGIFKKMVDTLTTTLQHVSDKEATAIASYKKFISTKTIEVDALTESLAPLQATGTSAEAVSASPVTPCPAAGMEETVARPPTESCSDVDITGYIQSSAEQLQTAASIRRTQAAAFAVAETTLLSQLQALRAREEEAIQLFQASQSALERSAPASSVAAAAGPVRKILVRICDSVAKCLQAEAAAEAVAADCFQREGAILSRLVEDAEAAAGPLTPRAIVMLRDLQAKAERERFALVQAERVTPQPELAARQIELVGDIDLLELASCSIEHEENELPIGMDVLELAVNVLKSEMSKEHLVVPPGVTRSLLADAICAVATPAGIPAARKARLRTLISEGPSSLYFDEAVADLRARQAVALNHRAVEKVAHAEALGEGRLLLAAADQAIAALSQGAVEAFITTSEAAALRDLPERVELSAVDREVLANFLLYGDDTTPRGPGVAAAPVGPLAHRSWLLDGGMRRGLKRTVLDDAN